MTLPNEHQFESEIASHLTGPAGHTSVKFGNRTDSDFDRDLGLDPVELFTFITASQPAEWTELVRLHAGGDAGARAAFLRRLAAEIDKRGTVDVLRHGVVDLGVTIKLAQFRPAHGLTPELDRRYRANRLTVVRQLRYGESNRTIDLALFVNGLPVATAELKSPLQGQTVDHAVEQYRQDRDPRNVTLSKRAVVHFAVDPDSVLMTTHLAGAATRFLPFNMGHDHGPGNPPNPAGHRTAYLWERVWQRDAWLDILARFIHVEKDRHGRPVGMIFPRFHQWDAVLRLEAAARADGAGHSYQVQHSAGSGKSHTIAWLAHRLMTLHRDDGEKVFDKVVVITDRVVLDRQLQDTIYQLEHAHGAVEKIDAHSGQLADALLGEQARIIITTLQKFPLVIERTAGARDRRYAVMVDEAHSSQTGEAAKDLRVVLGASEEVALAEAEGSDERAPLDDAQDFLERQVRARGRQPNLSFFAFTATPKGKTLELFGTRDAGGTPHPFHLYSMRQAILEGFILDVLASYVTYHTYYRLRKAIRDDPHYPERRARRALGEFAALHPQMLGQKAEIIVEHFREHVRHLIGGHAKAMVVTSSRLHAVRYKQALDAYINRHGYDDVRTLVAFSGPVTDRSGEVLTEVNMNRLPESRTAEAFGTDEYQVMVVAEKFQTGFDQPLLHTMYVDKVLTGLNAVQTLSRLNRIHPEKDSTFVLDFRNEAEEIEKAFSQFYRGTTATPTDPNALYDARHALDSFGVLREEDTLAAVAALAAAGPDVSARVHAAVAPAIERFHSLDPLRQDEFRGHLDHFVRTYAFLSHVVNFADTELERDHLFCRALGSFIRAPAGARIDLGNQVELSHLRQALTFEGRIEIRAEATPLTAVGNPGTMALPLDEALLSQIVRTVNERHGITLTEADQLQIQAMASSMVADEQVREEAAANSLENFALAMDPRLRRFIAGEMQRNETFGLKLLNDEALRRDIGDLVTSDVWAQSRVLWQRDCPIGELLEREEDQGLEYKSSLEWDRRDERRNRALRVPVIKTIAAFLNSRHGGTLVLGVADDHGVSGLEADYAWLHKESRDDRDRLRLHLDELVVTAVGPAAATRVVSAFHHVDGRDLCRVHVEPSPHPVYAKLDGPAAFYVRSQARTIEIRDEAEIERYITGRRLDLAGPTEIEPAPPRLPVYSLLAAAGRFLRNEPVEPLGWVDAPPSVRPMEGTFVAQVAGRSMEPRIPDGSWVVLRAGVAGDRAGRIVLVELAGAEDPEDGGRYTLKRYRSVKRAGDDGSWHHESITLEPLNPEFEPIELSPDDDARVIAEYVETLPSPP